LEWAGSPNPVLRLESAQSIPSAQQRLEEDALTIVLLSLTRDPDQNVRAHADFALATTPSHTVGGLEQLVERRLLEIMNEPDARRPLAVLQGLRSRITSSSDVPPSLIERAEHLASDHLSALVRSSAAALITDIEPSN